METNEKKQLSYELGPIRPPSEAYSLLIRATRNCPWNKCRFCHTYKGRKFELRSVDEIEADIYTAKVMKDRMAEVALQTSTDIKEVAGRLLADPPSEGFRNVALWLYAGGENVFLQDANSLLMKTDDLVEVLRFLKVTFPGVKRITSYGRSQTANRKKPEELARLNEEFKTECRPSRETGGEGKGREGK